MARRDLRVFRTKACPGRDPGQSLFFRLGKGDRLVRNHIRTVTGPRTASLPSGPNMSLPSNGGERGPAGLAVE